MPVSGAMSFSAKLVSLLGKVLASTTVSPGLVCEIQQLADTG
jgi:hypothetical protein